MSEYQKDIEYLEGVGHYSSGFGDFDAVTHMARVAVLGPHQETVWERSIRDRIISFAIPIPFYDRRLGRLIKRADALVETLNSD
jgi:hypothetical protein